MNAESIAIIVYDDHLSSMDAMQVGTCFCNDKMHVSTTDILHNYTTGRDQCNLVNEAKNAK